MVRKSLVHGHAREGHHQGGYKSGTVRAAKRAVDAARWEALRASEALAEERELRLGELLSQAERMASLGTLAAGVAHEINNPLTYVLVNVEHVLRKMRAEMATADEPALASLHEYVSALTSAVEGGTRVRQIVRDLMTFARGNVDQRGVVDVRRTLESALQMAWHELRHRAVVDKQLHEVPPVLANEARLAHAFLTLLINAAQAIPEGEADRHRVTVKVNASPSGSIVVEIADTGSGIAPEVLPHVFEPFFTTKEAGSGTGMGLAVAHGTIRSLGGELTVESVVGEGSVFRVVLPVAEGFSSERADRPSQPGFALRRRVLVLDDDPRVAEAIGLMLADEHDVQVSSKPRESLAAIARGERYDVILCDLMMPEMTGMAFYREILRSSPGHAGRIVFLTGGTFTQSAREFVAAMPNRTIEKPPDSAKLRELVRHRKT